MNGRLAFEAMGALSDDLILESAQALGFMENSSAATASRRRGSSALSRFFGSGWGVAVICAIVSLSVLGGIVWAGQRPVAGPQDTSTESETVVETESESENKSDIESETESETEMETETETLPEFKEEIDPSAYYFQFPLTNSDDTASYVSVSDWDENGIKNVTFYILPTDVDDPKLTAVRHYAVARDVQMNMQIVLCKPTDSQHSYGLLFMYEYAAPGSLPGQEGGIVVTMDCYRLTFKNWKTHLGAGGGGVTILDSYDTVDSGYQSRHAWFLYEEGKYSQSTYYTNKRALETAESFIKDYNSDEYTLTVLYSYIDGVETINTPVDSIPEFSFPIFNKYNVNSSQPAK
ncbi:MAG: hypothetical protein IKM33_06320 [Clostridia bacterium]|nr:hypothetical protein [Clostridia bacterium]